MKSSALAGLILSGGASQRMGMPKALLKLQGQAFLDRLIAAFSPVCAPLIVVLGYDAERIREALDARPSVNYAVNPNPARGMFSSLQCGLRQIPSRSEAVIFTPVDYPAIRASTIASLAQAYERYRRPVTLPRHEGAHGHPVCISRSVIDQLLALPETAQARDLIHAYRPQTEFVDVDDPGILADIDVPEDYQTLQAQSWPAKL